MQWGLTPANFPEVGGGGDVCAHARACVCTLLLRARETSAKRVTGFDINQQDCIAAIIQQ